MKSNHSRPGFTLIELMVGTALAMFLIALVTTLWTETRKAVERTRAILAMDMKTRDIVDKYLNACDNRTGCLPMNAQNEASSLTYNHCFRVNESRSHIDLTKQFFQILPGWKPDPNTYYPRRWTRFQSPEWSNWNVSFPEPPSDIAKGQEIIEGSAGTNAQQWGCGEIAMWHGAVVRLDSPAQNSDVEWYRGGPAISAARPWLYFPGNWSWNLLYSRDTNKANPDDAAWDLSSIDRTPLMPMRRYTRNSATSYTNSNWGILGPLRGSTILPWYLDNSRQLWQGRYFIARAVNGPAFYGDRWLNNRYIVASTGDNGVEDASNHYEPMWYPNGSPPAAPNPADPGANRTSPPYGTMVEETNVAAGVGVRWRIEAPPVGYYQTMVSTSEMDMMNENGTKFVKNNGYYHTMYTPYNIKIAYAGGVGVLDPKYRDQYWNFANNISVFNFRSGRIDGSQPSGTAGRFGSLANGSWYDDTVYSPYSRFQSLGWDKVARGAATGYTGNNPTGNDSPGHPAWISLTIGMIGGFQEATSSAIERRWTITTALR